MRTEQDIIGQVLDHARADADIRAVVRTDLVPVRAYLKQYNFYFIVRDMKKYQDDGVFLTCFGERILLYRGDRNYPEMFGGMAAHLMVFRDGITMAVYAATAEQFLREFAGPGHDNVWMGRTYQKLLDKDGLLPHIDKRADEQLSFTERPTSEAFEGTCMEFFWVLKTFSEYVRREELPAAMFYLHVSVRDMLNRMLRWHIGMSHGFSVELGILDSYFGRHLRPELWALYRQTYPTAETESLRAAFDATVRLFRVAATEVAQAQGFAYPADTERDMLAFIARMEA